MRLRLTNGAIDEVPVYVHGNVVMVCFNVMIRGCQQTRSLLIHSFPDYLEVLNDGPR